MVTSLTSGIPQSDANPLLEDFNRPWEEIQAKQREDLERWRRESLANIDRALLDWDGFAKDKPIDLRFDPDPETARKRGIVHSYLLLHNNGRPLPGGDLGPQLFRDRLAAQKFGGRGKGDDLAFFQEIQKEATERKASKELLRTLEGPATRSAVLAGMGSFGELDADTFDSWREAARSSPGYRRDLEPDYLDQWTAIRNATLELFDEFPPLADTYKALQSGNVGTYDARIHQAAEYYASLPADQRERFVAAIALLSRTFPEEERRGFFRNLITQAGRDIRRITEDTVSGVETIVERGLYQAATGEPVPTDYKREADRVAYKDFQDDLARIQAEDYDPVSRLWGKGFWGDVEAGLYGTVGATYSTVTALNPLTSYALLQESARSDMRARLMAQGVASDVAGQAADSASWLLAGVQFLPERIGAGAIFRTMPALDRAFTAISDRVINRAVRGLTSAALAGGLELSTEVFQDFVPNVAQDILADIDPRVPGADWQQYRDEFWSQTTTTAVALLPLAIFTAGGGLSREANARAYADIDPRARRAFGERPEDTAAIEAAQEQGPASLQRAVETAIENRDPNSEAARNAVQELASQLEQDIQAAQATQQEAEAAGVVPRFVYDGREWTVLDSNTGNEIGKAPNHIGAVRLAARHSELVDLDRAEQVAFLSTLLEGAEVTATTNREGTRETTADVRPFDTVTTSQQAAESEQDEARIAAQLAARERLDGGDGSITEVVLGQSVTDFRQRVRNTALRINAGGSLLTVFHEETHGFWREALATGRLTRQDAIDVLRSLETVLAGKRTSDGQALRFLPEADAEITDTAIDEAIAELMEAEIVRSRRRTGRRPLPQGIVTRNLSAMARLRAGAVGKFSAFLRAVREFWGRTFARAVTIQNAIRKGEIDEAKLDDFVAKLFGLEEQDELNAEAARFAEEILGEPTTPGDLTAAEALDVDAPFSLGPAPLAKYDALQREVPQEGQVSAIKLKTGHLLTFPGNHVLFMERHGIRPHDVESGGWVIDGQYEPSDRSDTMRWVRHQMSKGSPSFSIGRVTLTREPYQEKGSDLRERIIKDVGNSITNIYTGWEIGFFKDGASHIISQNKGKSRSILPHLKELMEQSVWLGRRPHRDADKPRGLRWQHLFYVPYSSPEGNAIARFVINETWQGERLIDAKSAEIKEVPDGFTAGGDRDGQRTQIGPSGKITLRDLARTVNELWPDDIASLSPPRNDRRDGGFSLGNSAVAATLRDDAVSRIRDPQRRAETFSRIARNLENLRMQLERLELQIGSKRLRKSLQREAAVRLALRQEELENQAYARHFAILSDDDLTRLFAQPVHAVLSEEKVDKKGRKYRRGRLMSRTAAAKRHPDLFGSNSPSDYDGSENVNRAIFGGTLMPDQAAQELYEQGLIKEPTTDALWTALEAEGRMVDNMRQALDAAKADLRAARSTAQAEAKQWLTQQIGDQEIHFSDKQEILRSLALLDGILAALPSDLRGRIGGYTQLARIATNENRLAFLRERMARADKLIEDWLRRQFDREFRALLLRARPEKDEAGQRPRGKIGSDIHALFRDIGDAMLFNATETEAEALRLETIATDPDLSPEEQSHATLQAQLTRLVGDWRNADAGRREAALLEAERIYRQGYLSHQTEMKRKAERRGTARTALQNATRKSGHRMERVERAAKDATRRGVASQAILSLLSFEQVVHAAFGEQSPEANLLVDWERRAANAKHDAVTAKETTIDRLFADLAGSRYQGERLRWEMANTRKIRATDGIGIEHTFTELEAITATLMWRQEDGRRHMEGYLDENGKPSGSWHWTQQAIDQIEDQLTDNAKVVRLHLSEAYAAEYDRLNSIYRQLYGVSLPRHKFYSPLTVKPIQGHAAQDIDPVTGFAGGQGFTPGSLKTRSTTAIAEPEFRDALQTYIAHTKQMEHWMAYAPFTQEAQAIIGNRELGNSIEAAGGKETLTILRSWLDLFAQGGNRDAAAQLELNKLFTRMTGRAATAALVGRASVLVIQSTQLLAGLAQMPTGAFLTRFAKLMTGQLGWGTALKSDFIRRRLEQMPPIVRQAMEGLNTSKPSRLKHIVGRIGETIAGTDALFTAGTYAIIYDYQLGEAGKLGLSGPEAEAFAREAAERSTERVAQPTRMGTRSLYEATATNPAARILWSFASEPRQKLALSAYAFAKQPWPQKARAFAVTWLVGGMVATLIRAIMADLRNGDDDEWFDERHWDPGRLALSSLTGPFQGVPILGDGIQAAVFKLFDEYLPEGNLFSGLERGAKAATNIPDILALDRDFDDAVKDIEAILGGAALLSDSAAAASAVSHIVSDIVRILDNIAGD